MLVIMVSNTFSKTRVLILLAPGFEEFITVYCLEQMREASLQVSLVGLSNGLVCGLHGLKVQPDISLEQLDKNNFVKLIVVPGGRNCTASLLADPRVHQLLQTTITTDGIIAATKTSSSLLTQSGLTQIAPDSWLLPPHEFELGAFTDQLIHTVTH